MKFSLYANLAASNIRKNRRLYVPFLLTGICMVMIHYILGALTGDPAIRALPGGEQLQLLLALGSAVMVIFSAIFLLYTSSFLMKQRSRELSLYNILGMSKRHVGFVLFFETLDCAAICLAAGLVLGVLFSKAFQLVLLRLMHSAVSADFTVSLSLLRTSALFFGAIFALICLRSLFAVCRSNAIELLHSSQAGEKPPRANAVPAILGVLMLGTGYVMALRVRSALDAFSLFFSAVLLVIGGTVLCFRSASVFLLRLLKANKTYYYKANHFISVSGMSYRMKRNGSSLATICILSTMVLVMLSSVTCLYIGTEDSLRTQYPREIELISYSDEMPPADLLSAPAGQALAAEGLTPQNEIACRSIFFAGKLKDGVVSGDVENASAFGLIGLSVIPLEDYNRIADVPVRLAQGEALASGPVLASLDGTINLFGQRSYRLIPADSSFTEATGSDFDVVETLLLVVPSAEEMEAINRLQAEVYGKNASSVKTSYAFDTGLDDEAQIALAARVCEAVAACGINLRYQTRAGNRAEFFSFNTGFLFLGAMLSLAFLCATVLSMYYKQITEGYEDQARFAIMRKVGLSRRMIRQSVNSQILTVFFLPLLTAGLHTSFAFPMISKLLLLFSLGNTRLLALTTLASFGAFSILYIAVYLITSRTYYKIVAGTGEA